MKDNTWCKGAEYECTAMTHLNIPERNWTVLTRWDQGPIQICKSYSGHPLLISCNDLFASRCLFTHILCHPYQMNFRHTEANHTLLILQSDRFSIQCNCQHFEPTLEVQCQASSKVQSCISHLLVSLSKKSSVGKVIRLIKSLIANNALQICLPQREINWYEMLC